MGSPQTFVPDVRPFRAVVPASSSLDVILHSFADFLRGTFEIALFNTAESKLRSLTAKSWKIGGSVDHSIYNDYGDNIDIVLNFQKVGADVVLSLSNSEAFAVTLRMESIFVRGN